MYYIRRLTDNKILRKGLKNKKEAMKIWRKLRKVEVCEWFLEFCTNLLIERETKNGYQ